MLVGRQSIVAEISTFARKTLSVLFHSLIPTLAPEYTITHTLQANHMTILVRMRCLCVVLHFCFVWVIGGRCDVVLMRAAFRVIS